MFAKIQELKSMGYKKLRAARELNIDVKTVRKYWDMREEEYSKYLTETKSRSRIMEPYREVILDKLIEHSDITSALIYDRLIEADKEFQLSYRSVRLYISELRESEGIPTP